MALSRILDCGLTIATVSLVSGLHYCSTGNILQYNSTISPFATILPAIHSVCLSVRLSVSWSVSRSLGPSLGQSVRLSVNRSVSRSISLSLGLLVGPSLVPLSVRVSVGQLVCLGVQVVVSLSEHLVMEMSLQRDGIDSRKRFSQDSSWLDFC